MAKVRVERPLVEMEGDEMAQVMRASGNDDADAARPAGMAG